MNFPALPGILEVEQTLGKVLGEHLYLGGACVGFYMDDPGAAEIRPTDDVDVVVEVASEVERAALEDRIRRAGLEHDLEGPICRWRLGHLKVDVMATSPDIYGFANRWYPEAFLGSETISVGNAAVRIPHVWTFIATKIEAFQDRGQGDYFVSPDFEDIVRIFDGCTYLEDRADSASPEVSEFVRNTLAHWVSENGFIQAVEAHLLDANRAIFVFDRMKAL